MIIMRDVDDPRIKMLPGITKVEVADDLSVANIYVSIMGTPGQQTAALNALKHSAGMLRTRLAKMLTIRQMPFLNFKVDEGHRKEIEMLELLHKLEVERLAREAEKNGGVAPDAEVVPEAATDSSDQKVAGDQSVAEDVKE